MIRCMILGILLLLAAPVWAVDPACDTSWSKTGTVWTCTGNGTVTFAANSSFVPNANLTIVANKGFYFTNNQIGSANRRVNLQSDYGDFNGSGSTVFGNLLADSGEFFLQQTTVNGTITTRGDINLSGGSVTGKVTSSSNSVTTNGTNLSGGVQSHADMSLTGGTIAGALTMTAANNLQLFDLTMTSGSISGASHVYLSNADVGSGSNSVSISAQTNDIYVLNGSVVYGNLTAAGNYGVVYVQGGSAVYGTCLPNTNPVNACNASPPPTVHHYELQYSAPGVTCEAEPVTIRACSNQACSSYYSGPVSVTLTASGNGSWSNTTPVFSSGSASSSLRLTTPGSSSIGISSANPAAANALVCKNGSTVDASCSVSFLDTALKIYDSDGLSALPVLTAGVSRTATLRAIRTNSNTGACEARVQGQRQVGVAFRCLNPSSCISGQTISQGGFGIGGSSASSAPSYINVPLTFDASGKATVPFSYSDVGQIALHARLVLAASGSEPAITLTAPEAVTVVKPHTIAVFSVTAVGALQTNPATTNSGNGFIAAGAPFRVLLEVRNALGNRTPNFGNESSPEPLTVSFNQQVFPANGHATVASLLNTGSFTVVSGTAGRFQNTQLYYMQAGSFNLYGQLGADNSYLGAGPVANQPVSATIGRFFPQHFELSNVSVGAICNSGTPFSYLGQPGLPISFLLKAVSATTPGGRKDELTNYDVDWYGANNVAGIALVAENNASSHSANLHSRLAGLPAATPGSNSWQHGQYQFNSGSNLQLKRVLAADGVSTLPDGPFLQLQWGVKASGGLDSRNLPTLNMNAATAGTCVGTACDAALLGSPQALYYGRLLLADAYGSVTQPLPVQINTQSWDGLRFVSHSADQCSQSAPASLTVSGSPALAVSGSTAALISGRNPVNSLLIQAPNQDSSRSMQYQTDSWLRYNWNTSTAGDENPSATAIFGRYRGNDRLIYWREQ